MKDHESLPFDARPDAVLGAALRAALEPGPAAGFVARVAAGFDAARAPLPAVELLARWAGRGIAAAAVLALAAALAGRAGTAPASLDDALVASSDAATSVTTELLVGDRAPDPAAVFAAVVGAER